MAMVVIQLLSSWTNIEHYWNGLKIHKKIRHYFSLVVVGWHIGSHWNEKGHHFQKKILICMKRKSSVMYRWTNNTNQLKNCLRVPTVIQLNWIRFNLFWFCRLMISGEISKLIRLVWILIVETMIQNDWIMNTKT